MGQIEIDEGIYRKLTSTNHFPVMSKEEDEAEHSLELHLPFIMHRMEGREFTVVPIVVGALNSKDEAFYADLLSEYFLDPQNFFIISSDFCHWGSRFSYMYWEREDGEIHESVEKLDRRAMATIEAADPAAFSNYLLETKNTICGRHPIGVFLNLLQLCHGPKSACVRFTKYDQSQRCKSTWESSVSYAAAVVMLSDVLDGVTEDVGDAVA